MPSQLTYNDLLPCRECTVTVIVSVVIVEKSQRLTVQRRTTYRYRYSHRLGVYHGSLPNYPYQHYTRVAGRRYQYTYRPRCSIDADLYLVFGSSKAKVSVRGPEGLGGPSRAARDGWRGVALVNVGAVARQTFPIGQCGLAKSWVGSGVRLERAGIEASDAIASCQWARLTFLDPEAGGYMAVVPFGGVLYSSLVHRKQSSIQWLASTLDCSLL